MTALSMSMNMVAEKIYLFVDGKGPCSPTELAFVPSGYRFQMFLSF